MYNCIISLADEWELGLNSYNLKMKLRRKLKWKLKRIKDKLLNCGNAIILVNDDVLKKCIKI